MANSLVPFMTEDEYLARERASGHPKPYPAVLRLLSDAAPVYATFRNHDGGLWARDANSFAGCSAIGTYSRSLESR